MKRRSIIISALTLLLCVAGVQLSYARSYTGDQKIYVKISDEWKTANPKIYVYIFQSWDSDTKWIPMSHLYGNVYEGTVPNGYWDRCIVTRQNPALDEPGWDTGYEGCPLWGQTANITISDNPSTDNYIHSFGYGTGASWGHLYLGDVRTFAAGDKVYVKSVAKYSDDTEANWADGGANLYLYCFGEDASQWLQLENACGNIYEATMPAKKWRACVVTRQSGAPSAASDWSKVWNQTDFIPFATITSQNYLHSFKEGTSNATWGTMPAQSHDGTEVIYINRYPSDWGWFGDGMEDGNHVFAYFYNSVVPDCYAWSEEISPYAGSGYLLEIPIPAGSWTNMILTRQKSGTPGWGNLHQSKVGDVDKDNKSDAMPLEIKYLHNFKMDGTGGEGWQWQAPPAVTPTPELASIGGATREDVTVCKQSIDKIDPYTLAPKINTATKKYAYDESGAPIWWRWSSTDSKWELLSNNWKDINKLLTDEADAYYYLWTYNGISSYRRFIHLQKEDCELACEITSFEYVLTPVNAVDSTFALEGSIAFTKTAGKLVLTYRDSVLEFESPESPLVFSMKGLKADGKADGSVKYHFIAKFSGDDACVADSIVTAPELTHGNVVVGDLADVEDYFAPYTTQYIHNSSVTLIPGATVAEGDSFTWTDGSGKIVKSGNKGEDCRYTVNKDDHELGADSTLMFIYTEYNKAPEAGGNLMNNGGYETTDPVADADVDASKYKDISAYKYTGVWCAANGKQDVYENGYGNQNSLFGVTDNANQFWLRMAHVTPKEGVYLAAFDGDSNEKTAWKAVSGVANPDLKLKKGTTYMFSFWVANINNYGEMVSLKSDGTRMINNAILQFKIRYKDGDEWVEEFLGTETDLNEEKYFNNFWHQNSATFTSPVDADDVIISVVDKNTNDFSIGNDFALDDIRFREVSVMTSTIRLRERFDVKFEEPATKPVNLKVEWVTKPACGQDTCTLRVSFRYPNITSHDIKLTIKDLNTSNTYGTLVDNVLLSKTPIVGNPDSTDYIGYFTSRADDGKRIPGAIYKAKVKADAATHNFQVKLTVKDDKDVDHGGLTNKSELQAPGVPALKITDVTLNKPDCSGLTYTLDVDIDYTALSGTTLSYQVDGVSKATRPIDYDVTKRAKNDVMTSSLPADGKKHTLKVSTGHALDCIDTYTYTAPKANIVSKFSVEPIQPDCDDETFRLIASWEVTKPDVTGSLFDTLMIKVGDASPYQILIKAGEPGVTISGNKATGTFEIPIDYTIGDLHPAIKAYMKERGSSCSESGSYTDPTTPHMNLGEARFENINCNDDKFDLIVPDTFVYQRGDLQVWIDAATYDAAAAGQKVTITNDNYCPGVTTGSKYYTDNKSELVADIKFTGLTLTGEHTIYAKCTGSKSCEASRTFTAPDRPKAELKNIKYPTTRDCDVDTLHLDFDLYYTYQQGDLTVWLTGTGVENISQTVTPAEYGKLNTEEDHRHFKMVVPADGVDRVLHYQFASPGICSGTKSLTPIPRTPMIDSVKVTDVPASATCHADYNANVTVWYHNVISTDKIILEYPHKDGTRHSLELSSLTPEASSVTKSAYTFNHKGFGKDTIYAYFNGETAEVCKYEGNHFKEFKTPSTSSIESDFRIATTERTCGDSTYTVSGELHFTDAPSGASLVVEFDDKHKQTFMSYSSPQAFTITGMKATGTQSLSAYFSTDSECPSTCEFEAPAVPDFFVSNMHYKTPQCDDVEDVLVFDLTYTYQSGTLKAWVDGGTKNVVDFDANNASAQTKTNIEIPGVPADGAEHTLHVQFEGGRCNADSTYTTPVAPFSGKIEPISTTISDESCGSATYSVTVTFNVSANSVGQIVKAECVGKSKSNTLTIETAGTNKIKIEGITRATPAADVSIELYFTANDNCDPRKSITYKENPFKPIPTVSLGDIDDFCYGTPELTVTYSMENATKYNYEVTRKTTSGTESVESETNQDAASIVLDTKTWEDGDYKLTITAVSTDGCTKSDSKTFTIWQQPKITIEQLVDACDDAENTSLKFNTTDALTYNYYIVGATNLLATPVSVTDGEHTVSLDIKSLNVGNVAKEYTLKMVANSTSCHSDTAEAKFTVNPLPELSFSSIADQCNSVSEVEVTYTPTNVKSFTYSVLKGSAPALVSNTVTVPAAEPYTFKVNTNGWGEGTYSITADLTSPNNCTAAATEANFIILPEPKVNSLSMQSRCYQSTDKAELSFSVSNATHYRYSIDGGAYSTLAEIGSSKCDIDVSALAVGKHSVSVIAYNGDCPSDPLTVAEAFEIYPLPTFTFAEGEVKDCYPSLDGISVGYSSTDADTYTFTLTNDETSVVALKSTSDLPAEAEGTVFLNTANIPVGTYTLAVQAKSVNQCTMEALATKTVTINVKPEVTKLETNYACQADDAEIEVTYELANASSYSYAVDGTTLAGGSNTTGSGTFKINVGTLTADTYTLQLTAISDADCQSEVKPVDFTIHPIPTVTFEPVSSIKTETPTLPVTISNLPHATKYDYWVEDLSGNKLTEVGKGSDIPYTQKIIILNTKDLLEAVYKLYVLPKSETCEGQPTPVDIVVNNKPTITFDAAEVVVCSSADKVELPFTTSDDAVKVTYSVANTSITDQQITLADHPSPLIIGVKDWAPGTYTVTAFATSIVPVDGDLFTKDFTLLANVTTFEIEPQPKSCDDITSYTVTGTVDANVSTGTIRIEHPDDPTNLYAEVDLAGTSRSFTIADIPAGSTTTLRAYVVVNGCDPIEKTYTEPTKPAATIEATVPTSLSCDKTTFDLPFKLTYTNQEAGTLSVWVDGYTKQTFTSGVDYVALATGENELTGTISGLDADGSTDKSLHFEFSGDLSCKGLIPLTFPRSPQITGVSVVDGTIPDLVPGVSGTYSPEFEVSYKWADDETLVLEYQKANGEWTEATTTVSGIGTYTFTGLTFDDVALGDREVRVHFQGAEFAECVEALPYVTPINSSITFGDVTVNDHSLCGQLLYDIIGTVSFVGSAEGDLMIELDGNPGTSIPNSQCVADKALDFRIPNVKSDKILSEGLPLKAYFANLPSNPTDYTLNADILLPTLSIEDFKVDTTFTCGDKLYTVSFTVQADNQRGEYALYDSIAGGAVRAIENTAVYPKVEFTIARPAKAEEHYVIVRYPTTSCREISELIDVNPYTKPLPLISLTPIERVCNSEMDLNLPIVITQGDVTEAYLTLTDAKEAEVISSAALVVSADKDMLTYTLPEQLAAGKYTVAVEARDAIGCTTSATMTIEMALDSVIYSKWSDVLLIDNSADLYLGYQWYENGQRVGDNSQVLYMPEGMNGTYCCRLTLKDGTQIYTCEYAFDEFMPSVEEQQSSSATAVNQITVCPSRVPTGGAVSIQQTEQETLQLVLMSVTGQRLGEYTQTESVRRIDMPDLQGIYLLRVATESDVQTVKIVVY